MQNTRMRTPTLQFGLMLVVAIGAIADEATAEGPMEILKRRCARCHGQVNPQSDFRVTSHRDLISKVLSDGQSLAVAPGDVEASELWQRIVSDDEFVRMPPSEPLPAQEQAVLRQWIESGAPDESHDAIPEVDSRQFISTHEIYTAVERDLNSHLPDEAIGFRYFSFQNLHNNRTISSSDLRIFRAALSKAINSLHWEPAIVVPVAVDKHQTVFRVNLTEIGWDRGRLWRKILKRYPYGLSYDSSRNHRLASTAANVYRATGSRIPIIRADWFVVNASIPPLYHTLLDLPDGPKADRALEYRLRVDVERDFQKNRLMRAGFVKSNVSEHNRLVDRHAAAYGAYWKSYDFASSIGNQDLTRAPLGPSFPGNEFKRHAFNADGGEIIFNLPNGMQGYMLVDGNGSRIDRGPINVVFDSKQPLRNKKVINGISCMVCHRGGMQPFVDSVLDATTLRGLAGQKVSQLFRSKDEMDRVIDQDSNRFLQALNAATGPFVEDAASREPVAAMAAQFSRELDLETTAAELGIDDPGSLQPLTRHLGFAVAGNGGLMKRDTWEGINAKSPYSKFQLVSELLEQGTPERVF